MFGNVILAIAIVWRQSTSIGFLFRLFDEGKLLTQSRQTVIRLPQSVDYIYNRPFTCNLFLLLHSFSSIHSEDPALPVHHPKHLSPCLQHTSFAGKIQKLISRHTKNTNRFQVETAITTLARKQSACKLCFRSSSAILRFVLGLQDMLRE